MEHGTHVIVWTAEAEAYHLHDWLAVSWVDELAEVLARAPKLDPVSFAALCAAMRESGLSVPES